MFLDSEDIRKDPTSKETINVRQQSFEVPYIL